MRISDWISDVCSSDLVLLRLSLLLFGDDAGPASSHFGSDWLLWGGVATIVAGTIGMLGARDLGKLAGYNVIISSGTLLGAAGLQQPAVTAGALAYLELGGAAGRERVCPYVSIS